MGSIMPSKSVLLHLFTIAAFLGVVPGAFADDVFTAEPGHLFIGAQGYQVLVVDEAKGKVVDKIPLKSEGLAFSLHLSYDKKKAYVRTITKNGIDVIDLTTRKVVNHIILNDESRKVNLRSFAPTPDDKRLYAVVSVVNIKPDRFEVEEPQIAVIDLEQRRITDFYPYPKEEGRISMWRGQMRVSPNGEYLYIFSNNVLIFDTTEFKLVDKIELSQPLSPGIRRVGFTPRDDPFEDRGTVIGIFSSSDPVAKRKIFGIASFDLDKRTFKFDPLGPADNAGMTGLQLSPDRKTGYTIAFTGGIGNRRSEFWAFDMATRKVKMRREFEAPMYTHFTLSGDGSKIYTFTSVAYLEVYDTATFERTGTIDLGMDRTAGPLVIPRMK